jgi:hypothetical protein
MLVATYEGLASGSMDDDDCHPQQVLGKRQETAGVPALTDSHLDRIGEKCWVQTMGSWTLVLEDED